MVNNGRSGISDVTKHKKDSDLNRPSLFLCLKISYIFSTSPVFYECVTFDKKSEKNCIFLLTLKNQSGIIRLTINATDCISDVIICKCYILKHIDL